MVNHGVSGITVNATLTALKFFFQITLDKPEVVARVCPVTVRMKMTGSSDVIVHIKFRYKKT
jgi:hypothetical protein